MLFYTVARKSISIIEDFHVYTYIMSVIENILMYC